jgi:sec-independent protein translocase protein TatC
MNRPPQQNPNQTSMRNFFRRIWNAVTFPFRWLGNLIAHPFRAVYRYMTNVPNSRSIIDTMAVLAQEDQARQSLIEHIEKFRMHLLRSLAALFIATAAAWTFIKPITEFLAEPIGGQKALQIIDLTEGVSVYMKVAFLTGFAVSIIYIAFEFWFYAAPGLTVRERWSTLIGIPLSAILFWLGVWFTYTYMLPTAIQILQSVGDFQANITADKYYSLITRLLLWIGLFFEFPLVTTILTRVGVITPKALASQWRLAIVVIGVIAAVITPTTDIGSMALVMAPMIVLYFISIGLSFLVYRRKTQDESLTG